MLPWITQQNPPPKEPSFNPADISAPLQTIPCTRPPSITRLTFLPRCATSGPLIKPTYQQCTNQTAPSIRKANYNLRHPTRCYTSGTNLLLQYLSLNHLISQHLQQQKWPSSLPDTSLRGSLDPGCRFAREADQIEILTKILKMLIPHCSNPKS